MDKMVKAVFIDFYGTVVHEDGEVIKKISQEIFDTGNVKDKSEIGAYWWNAFQMSFLSAYGDNFKKQRELEYQSLADTIRHFESTADAWRLSNMMFEHWIKPPIFEDARQFFESCPVPVYVVSNIDRDDVLKAIGFHNLKPAGVFTSEDAKSYKPRKELFEFALNSIGLSAEEVVHIGDSLGSDIEGAASVGINAIWVNRSGRGVPDGVISVGNLLEVLETDFFLKRLKSMINYKKPAFRNIVVAVVACVAIAACLLIYPAVIGNNSTLRLKDVITLSEKGYDLTWEDFDQYDYNEIGSGLYIRAYEIDEMFSLMMAGSGSLEEDPLYINLYARDGTGESIDIRGGGVEAYIAEHKKNPVERYD